jgi:hypothetical protein
MHVAPQQLIQELSSNVDRSLAEAVVDSYLEMQRRYLAGDWQPAELDGGRLCEAVSRAVYQLDTGTVTHSQLPGELRAKLLDEDKVQRQHNLLISDRQHVMKAIDLVYKFRSSRGAVHISPTYTANAMDSMLVLHAGKWIIGEFLRIAWNQDKKIVAATVEQLAQLEHSLVHELDGRPLVLAPGISAPDEILLLLFHAPGNRLSRADIRLFASGQKSNTLGAAVTRLTRDKLVRCAENGELVLTPLGQKRVMEQIIPKWTTGNN